MAYDMDTVEIALDALPADLRAAFEAAIDEGARTAVVIGGRRLVGIVPADEVEMLEKHEDDYFADRAATSRAAQGDRPGKPLGQVLAEVDAKDKKRGKAAA